MKEEKKTTKEEQQKMVEALKEFCQWYVKNYNK